jgi:predicted DNA-binding antitoxin AbrB/MazE fold protein
METDNARLSRAFYFDGADGTIIWSSFFFRPESKAMNLTVEAIYQNGVLKPAQPLPLQEAEKVRITIEPAVTWAERTAGMLSWTGDPELLRRIAEDDEFSILESP